MEDTLAFSSSTVEAATTPVREPTPHLRNGRIQPYSTKYTPSRYGYVHRTTKSRFPPTSGAVEATGGKGEPAKSLPEEQSLSVHLFFYCRWGTSREEGEELSLSPASCSSATTGRGLGNSSRVGYTLCSWVKNRQILHFPSPKVHRVGPGPAWFEEHPQPSDRPVFTIWTNNSSPNAIQSKLHGPKTPVLAQSVSISSSALMFMLSRTLCLFLPYPFNTVHHFSSSNDRYYYDVTKTFEKGKGGERDPALVVTSALRWAVGLINSM